MVSFSSTILTMPMGDTFALTQTSPFPRPLSNARKKKYLLARNALVPDRMPLLQFLIQVIAVRFGTIHIHLHRLRGAGHHEDHLAKGKIRRRDQHLSVSHLLRAATRVSYFHPIPLLLADRFDSHDRHLHGALSPVFLRLFVSGARPRH